jgi:hypothetical protein
MTLRITKPEINVREKISEIDKPSGVAGESMLRAETPQEQFNLIGAGRKNLILNGAMTVAQRGTSVTGVTSGQMRTCDRVGAYVNTGTWTAEQVADSPDEFQKSFKITCTTGATVGAADQVQFFYAIEGQDLAGLAKGTTRAKSFTISFWIKASKTGTSVLNIKDQTNNRHVTGEYTINSPDTWEKKSITFPSDALGPMPSTTTADMYLEFWLKAGSNISSGTAPRTWQIYQTVNRASGTNLNLGTSTNDYCQITGIQMELGKVATPFEHRSYGEELALCQRYFERLDDLGSTDSNGASSPETLLGLGYVYTTTRVLGHVTWKVTKRANPTCTVSPVTDIQCLSSAGAWISATGVDVRANKSSARLDITTGSAMPAAGQACEVRFNTASPVGYIYIDADI